MLLPMRKLLCSIWVLAAGLLSCGDSGSGADEPASANDVDTLCAAICDYQSRCKGSNAPDCLTTCKPRQGDPTHLSREALDIATRCFRDPACLDDDTCEERALTREPGIEALVSQCMEFARSCPTEIDLSLCLRAGMLTATLRAQAASCMQGECTSEKSATCFAL
jgi:hypothetical protein